MFLKVIQQGIKHNKALGIKVVCFHCLGNNFLNKRMFLAKTPTLLVVSNIENKKCLFLSFSIKEISKCAKNISLQNLKYGLCLVKCWLCWVRQYLEYQSENTKYVLHYGLKSYLREYSFLIGPQEFLEDDIAPNCK